MAKLFLAKLSVINEAIGNGGQLRRNDCLTNVQSRHYCEIKS